MLLRTDLSILHSSFPWFLPRYSISFWFYVSIHIFLLVIANSWKTGFDIESNKNLFRKEKKNINFAFYLHSYDTCPKLCVIELVHWFWWVDWVSGKSAMTILRTGSVFFLTIQNWVPRTNTLSDFGQSMLVLKRTERQNRF
jgi:hypothetical protein